MSKSNKDNTRDNAELSSIAIAYAGNEFEQKLPLNCSVFANKDKLETPKFFNQVFEFTDADLYLYLSENDEVAINIFEKIEQAYKDEPQIHALYTDMYLRKLNDYLIKIYLPDFQHDSAFLVNAPICCKEKITFNEELEHLYFFDALSRIPKFIYHLPEPLIIRLDTYKDYDSDIKCLEHKKT